LVSTGLIDVIIPEEAFVSMGDFERKVALSFNDKA
jgi:hypothetical protein